MALDILIVDDSAAIRKILLRVLTQTTLAIGKIHEAADGVEALRVLEANPVSLILSDINMPGMDGIELVTRVRDLSATRALPSLMIASQNDRHHWLKAEDAGVSGFVVKPFDAIQLGEEIARVLGS